MSENAGEHVQLVADSGLDRYVIHLAMRLELGEDALLRVTAFVECNDLARAHPLIGIGGRASIEQRYYITSVEDVGSFRRAVRSHWGIENELHWRLDVTFREDESRIRRGNAPHNMGVIRHVALNLLKREPTKISVRKKRIRAALNDGFRDNVLIGQ